MQSYIILALVLMSLKEQAFNSIIFSGYIIGFF